VFPEGGPTISPSDKKRSVGQNDFYFHRFPPKSPQKTSSLSVDSPESIALLESPGDIPGSTFFSFSGDRTSTGAPLYAGSPDLEPTVPGLFYLIHLKGGDFNVAGGSLPGFPAIGPVGFNGKISWSVTNGRLDELDYFVEKLNPANPNQYLTENGYRDFEIIEETLKIKTKSGLRDEKLQVKISRHGPIVGDVMPDAPANTAMQWMGSKAPTGVAAGCLMLNKASNFSEFRDALSRMKTMTSNIGYADAEGNIGYQMAGSPPIRKKGNGVLPVPGWTGEFEWIGQVPFEKLPYDLNPKNGRLGGFNNPPFHTDFHLTNYFLFERASCFEDVLPTLGKISLQDIRELQMNSYSFAAKEWVPRALNAFQGNKEVPEALNLFEGWDYYLKTDSAAATFFQDFFYRMMTNTLQDELGTELWQKKIGHYSFIYITRLLMHKIVSDKHHQLYDDVKTSGKKETRDDIIRKTVTETAAHLTDLLGSDPNSWKWVKVHKLKLKHAFGEKLTFLNPKPVSWPGDGLTMCSGRWDPRHGYDMISGGSIRIVVDFSDFEKSTFISPPGQSAHYTSPHYDDQLEIWASGKQIPINFLSGEELENVLILKKM